VKKPDKPRPPLKLSTSHGKLASEPPQRLPLQSLMDLVESVSQNLMDKKFDEALNANIAEMHQKLKVHGKQLETIFKDQLDRIFVIFRDSCQNNTLLFATRLFLLELVELRANQWSSCDEATTNIYYSARITSEIEPVIQTPDIIPSSGMLPSPTLTPPLLGPGELLKTSGKFPKPTKIPGKNYCKDEVVIRNQDSGKVNPGAKERLVQITGPTEDKIGYAKHLMEDTIRRNASPVREPQERSHMGGSSSSLNSSASDESNRHPHSGSRRSTLLHSYSTNDASLGEYKYTVTLGHDTVKILGSNYETVRNARLVLEEYYNVWLQKNLIGDFNSLRIDEVLDDVFVEPTQDLAELQLNSLDSGLDAAFNFINLNSVPQPEVLPMLRHSDSIPLSPQTQVCVSRIYSREFLVECALSQHSKVAPPNWDQIVAEFPAIAKKAASPFDPRAFSRRTNISATSVISSSQALDDPDSD